MPWYQPGPLYETCQLLAKAGRVLGIQLYFVLPAVHAEQEGSVGRTAGQIALELYLDLLHLFPRISCDNPRHSRLAAVLLGA